MSKILKFLSFSASAHDMSNEPNNEAPESEIPEKSTMNRLKQGFTLIELMVVIVIIGILAAIAIPKLFGMTSKAKASEVGTTSTTYHRLQESYIMEKGIAGTMAEIGFVAPTSEYFTYTSTTAGTLTSTAKFSDCANEVWTITVDANGDATRTRPAGKCGSLTPTFGTVATATEPETP